MKRLLAFFLVLILIAVGFSGCKKPSVVGVWSTEIDLAQAVQDILKKEIPNNETKILVEARLTFREDKTFTIQLDEASLGEAVTDLVKDLKDSLLDGITGALDGTAVGDAVDKILGIFGTDTDAITGDLSKDLNADSLLEFFTGKTGLSGYYKVAGNNLFLFPDEDSKIPDSYILMDLQEQSLELKKHIGSNPFVTENLLFRTLPLSFTRVQ